MSTIVEQPPRPVKPILLLYRVYTWLMERFPEILVGVAVVSGVVYLLEQKSQTGIDYAVKWTSIILMIVSLLGAIAIFLIDQKRKTRP